MGTERAGVPVSEPDDAVLAVLDALPLPSLLVGADAVVRYSNAAWRSAVELLDDDRLRCAHGETDYFEVVRRLGDDPATQAFAGRMAALFRGELAVVEHEYGLACPGGTRWYRLEAAPIGGGDRFVVTHTDITARVRASRESAWLARHDPLTTLPNRSHLHQLVDAELRREGRGPMSLLLLDVDGFSDVNDASGHEAGDELLRQVAARLRRVARGSDVVGRLGDDEFLLVSPDCPGDCAVTVAQRCQEALAATPFTVAGRVVRLGVSVGVATAAPGAAGLAAAGLVRDADLALSAARASGRGAVRAFSPELRLAAERRAVLGVELERAIEAGELVLHYQPILHLPTGEFNGVEALVRWQHPERGLLPPGEFLAVAEQYDLLVPLTRWVLREATRQNVAWREQGLDLVTGVNLSARHLSTGTLVDDVLTALAESGMPPSNLVCELTETSVAEDPECAALQLAELRRNGVEVSIDDFGSGFSSIGQLVNLPTGVLKIDRSLVAFPEGRRHHAAAAIAAVVALGRACGIQSLAEGVETAEQLQLAAELGCSFAQGYHLARPMPAAEATGWLAARGGGPTRARSCPPGTRCCPGAEPRAGSRSGERTTLVRRGC
ncbi:bifunctional diguanylate cyclase/phosphodiesterase [Blastococcus sp. TF02A-26]|uniref:putative bifunctional diguanylate cyclase/phosphodiesterase n=1 Tax=Blastococcus sp. TF02A-26 TaxID=2250577 RepID=UPI000DE8086E|nr:EAL domain-containing protein [Blastococcus sp. TF02A-26]RBY85395.1 GGDEF-domain containing protein [Blastococcus sp. TF02A-26]